MFNRSVWYTEVDTALYKLIQETVCYTDEQGEKQFVEPRFSMDEEDLKKMELPTVIIRSLGEQFDLYRYDPNPVKVQTSEDGKLITYEESAKPYTLKYQLDFLSRYKIDMNDILRSWCVRIPKRFLLDVIDSEENPRQCYMVQVSPNVAQNQKVGENTLYRTVLQYNIRVELDEGQSYEVNGASSVNLGFK